MNWHTEIVYCPFKARTIECTRKNGTFQILAEDNDGVRFQFLVENELKAQLIHPGTELTIRGWKPRPTTHKTKIIDVTTFTFEIM